MSKRMISAENTYETAAETARKLHSGEKLALIDELLSALREDGLDVIETRDALDKLCRSVWV